MRFSKKKFLAFPPSQQHKKAATLLRIIYTKRSSTSQSTEELDLYNQLCTWMDRSPLMDPSLEEISHRFHDHQTFTTQNLTEPNLLPRIRTGDQLSDVPYLPITIYLDSLRSAHNVGSIIRTTEAFRLGQIYFGGSTPNLHHPQVRKTSMSTWEKVRATSTLHQPIIALETSTTAAPLYQFPFPKQFTLALGNEEIGLSKDMLHQADHFVEIPLLGSKNSLNVANAFAIVAAEIRRQLTGPSHNQS